LSPPCCCLQFSRHFRVSRMRFSLFFSPLVSLSLFRLRPDSFLLEPFFSCFLIVPSSVFGCAFSKSSPYLNVQVVLHRRRGPWVSHKHALQPSFHFLVSLKLFFWGPPLLEASLFSGLPRFLFTRWVNLVPVHPTVNLQHITAFCPFFPRTDLLNPTSGCSPFFPSLLLSERSRLFVCPLQP